MRAAGRMDVGLAVELGVQLCAEEDRQGGVVKPEQRTITPAIEP